MTLLKLHRQAIVRQFKEYEMLTEASQRLKIDKAILLRRIRSYRLLWFIEEFVKADKISLRRAYIIAAFRERDQVLAIQLWSKLSEDDLILWYQTRRQIYLRYRRNFPKPKCVVTIRREFYNKDGSYDGGEIQYVYEDSRYASIAKCQTLEEAKALIGPEYTGEYGKIEIVEICTARGAL